MDQVDLTSDLRNAVISRVSETGRRHPLLGSAGVSPAVPGDPPGTFFL